MQWPELLLLAAMFAAACSVALPSWARYRRPLLALALVLGIAEGWYRVMPWQLAPAAVAWLVLVMAFRRHAHDAQPSRISAGLALALLSTSVGLLIVLPFFTLPRPTGPYAVGTQIVQLDDLSRTIDGAPKTDANLKMSYRSLVAQVWYPAEPGSRGRLQPYVRAAEMKPITAYQAGIRTNSIAGAAIASHGAPFPVLVYGHSWGIRRTVDTFLAEDLASHGYVVIALDHELNTARELLPGGEIIRSNRADALARLESNGAPATLKLWSDELAIWVADDRFALNQLAAANDGRFQASGLAWLAHRLDLSRVGAFGHSFGGAASFALLGQPDQPGTPEVRAAANLDGWTFDGLSTRTTQPILMIYAGQPPQPRSSARARRHRPARPHRPRRRQRLGQPLRRHAAVCPGDAAPGLH